MDSILHSIQKQSLLNSIPTTTTPPPAYSRAASPSADSDTSDDAYVELRPPATTIRINAATTLHGSNNVVCTSPSFDTARLVAVVSSALARSSVQMKEASRRSRNINIEVNCGVTIVGDRNVVGGLPGALLLRRRQMSGTTVPAAMSGKQAEVGCKRKADGEDVDEGKRLTKKAAVS